MRYVNLSTNCRLASQPDFRCLLAHIKPFAELQIRAKWIFIIGLFAVQLVLFSHFFHNIKWTNNHVKKTGRETFSLSQPSPSFCVAFMLLFSLFVCPNLQISYAVLQLCPLAQSLHTRLQDKRHVCFVVLFESFDTDDSIHESFSRDDSRVKSVFTTLIADESIQESLSQNESNLFLFYNLAGDCMNRCATVSAFPIPHIKNQ